MLGKPSNKVPSVSHWTYRPEGTGKWNFFILFHGEKHMNGENKLYRLLCLLFPWCFGVSKKEIALTLRWLPGRKHNLFNKKTALNWIQFCDYSLPASQTMSTSLFCCSIRHGGGCCLNVPSHPSRIRLFLILTLFLNVFTFLSSSFCLHVFVSILRQLAKRQLDETQFDLQLGNFYRDYSQHDNL